MEGAPITADAVERPSDGNNLSADEETGEVPLPAAKHQHEPFWSRSQAQACCSIGRRPYMEDTHIIIHDLSMWAKEGGHLSPDWLSGKNCSVFGVFDGHGGSYSSSFLSAECPVFLLQALARGSPGPEDMESAFFCEALSASFAAADSKLRVLQTEAGKDDGSTAVVAILGAHDLHVAHSGDSRALLCRNGEALALTFDHKPSVRIERLRIMEAGGQIDKASWFGLKMGPFRVYCENKVGGLAVARAFGDFTYKSLALPVERMMVTVVPDTTTVTLTEHDTILILASDGLFDVMSNEQVIEHANQWKGEGLSPSLVADRLVDKALKLDSMDNITVVCVFLDGMPRDAEGGGFPPLDGAHCSALNL